MIRILRVKSSDIADPLLVGDDEPEAHPPINGDVQIEEAAKEYEIPIFSRPNGRKFCLIRNGKEQILLDAGITEATAEEADTLKIRYGV